MRLRLRSRSCLARAVGCVLGGALSGSVRWLVSAAWFFEKVRSAAGAMARRCAAAVQLRGADGLSTFDLSGNLVAASTSAGWRPVFLVLKTRFVLQLRPRASGVVRYPYIRVDKSPDASDQPPYSETPTWLIQAPRAVPLTKSHSFDLRGGGGTTGRRRPGPVSPARPAPRRAPTSAA